MFTYDKIGNRMSEVRGSVGSLFTYHQNPSGGNSPRLASVTNGSTTLTYGYDAAGNTTSIVATNPPSTSTFILNYRSELASIKSSGGGTNLSYDGRGFLYRSVGKSTPRFDTDFIYGSDGMLWEYATEDVAARETHVHRIVRFGGRPVAVVRWGEPLEAVQRRYYTTDHLGTPILVTDEAGDEVWSGGFGAFGEDTYFGAFGSDIRLGLPGQFNDPAWAPATTLRYNVHRWYEPQIGRYARPDPLGAAASLNGFAYVDSRPTYHYDPLGLVSWSCSFTYGAGGLPPSPGVTVGGGGITAQCTSSCACGKRVSTVVTAPLGGASFGLLPVGITDSAIELTDEADCPSAESLDGPATLAGGGLSTPLGGYGCTSLNLGSATGFGCGGQGGFDFGGDWYFGYGLAGQTTEECCRNAAGPSD